MPQCTSATFSRVERAGPGERHARPDRPPPSIDRWTGRISTNATSRRRHDGVRRAPEPIRSGRGGARPGWGAAGTLPRVAEGEVREDLPDDHGIVQRGDQAQPAPAMGTR
jgi:hypothetical protein